MEHYSYKTSGTCSQMIEFDLDEEENIHDLRFVGGCNGNLKGIGRLCEGRNASDIAHILEGTTCGWKNTSCPDQLAKALKQAVRH